MKWRPLGRHFSLLSCSFIGLRRNRVYCASNTHSQPGDAKPDMCAVSSATSVAGRGSKLFLVVVAVSLWSSCGGGSGGSSNSNSPGSTPGTNQSSVRISTDPFTNTTSQHQTQVEPDTFAFGKTIVAAFQSGRFFQGGASDISFATSTNAGATWTTGNLPGITKVQNAANPYDRVSDPTVAYDAAHQVWMIASLPIVNSNAAISAVLVSRSTDGVNWQTPVTVGGPSTSPDKDWIVCDNTPSSQFYGHCYVEWDDFANKNLIQMNTSTDGGLTWGPSLSTANAATGLGGQPLVQPDGTVIVPMNDASQANVLAFRSTDGGASWTATVTVAAITDHLVAGGLRTSPLPSAEMDSAGTVYVAWQDCRFRPGCTANDILLSSSKDGLVWSAPARIPIDATSSTVDHFIPGLAVDRTTSGSTAHLALAYYFYSDTACTEISCQLNVGFTSSADGGQTWTAAQTLAGPMNIPWLADTNQGFMVGDYISTSYVNGKAHPVFSVASANSGTVFNEAMFTSNSGLSQSEQNQQSRAMKRFAVRQDEVVSFSSDHPPRTPVPTW